MNSSSALIITLLLTSISHSVLLGQYITNPSLEGSPQMHVAPAGWLPCDDKSTPDTQPGIWGHSKPASDGNTYLSMVTRGNWGGNALSTEDIQTELLSPLNSLECYTLSIDLSTCTECGHASSIGWISYARPVMLDIYISDESCNREEKIARIGPIDHTNWQTYSITFSPKTDQSRYIIFKADWVELPEYFGTILLDNIKLRQSTPQEVVLDQTLETGDTIKLRASEGGAYFWSPQELLSCADCPDPTANFQDSKVYTVTIIDSNLVCPRKEVFRLWTASFLFIPNAFTPNGDGRNDFFKAYFSGNLIRMNLQIYNRSGNLVFETTDPEQAWDGRATGDFVPIDTYVWKVDYEIFIRKGQQRFVEVGKVTVLR